MDLKELLIACDGQDVHGMPKSTAVIINEYWYQNGEKQLLNEVALESPTVKCFAGDGFLQLDLDFGSKRNADLGYAYDVLSNFREVENSVDDSAERIPVTTIVLMPAEYENQYYIACFNPAWVGLTAKTPNDDLAIIRMTFLEDNVMMYEAQVPLAN